MGARERERGQENATYAVIYVGAAMFFVFAILGPPDEKSENRVENQIAKPNSTWTLYCRRCSWLLLLLLLPLQS